jgi:hypothetical protein
LFAYAKDLFGEAIHVIEPGASLPLPTLDQGEFTEGHELDRKWQVPKAITLRQRSLFSFRSWQRPLHH